MICRILPSDSSSSFRLANLHWIYLGYWPSVLTSLGSDLLPRFVPDTGLKVDSPEKNALQHFSALKLEVLEIFWVVPPPRMQSWQMKV